MPQAKRLSSTTRPRTPTTSQPATKTQKATTATAARSDSGRAATAAAGAPVEYARALRGARTLVEAREIGRQIADPQPVSLPAEARATFERFIELRSADDRLDATGAQAIVRELKSEGYRAAVWYAQARDRQAVVDEIAGEFGDIADILQSHSSGIVADPRHGDVAAEIEHLLSARFKTGADSFTRPLQPVKQHLIHDQGRKTFEADKVILIYALGPATT